MATLGRSAFSALAVGVVLATPAWAQGSSSSGQGGEFTRNTPRDAGTAAIGQASNVPAAGALGPVISNAPIPHATGGIGDAGQARMQDLRDQYNLRLTFAQGAAGEFLADVNVKIVSQQNRTVLDTTSTGPMLFAQLPPGDYEVQAETARGESQSQEVQIGNQGPQDVLMRFTRE